MSKSLKPKFKQAFFGSEAMAYVGILLLILIPFNLLTMLFYFGGVYYDFEHGLEKMLGLLAFTIIPISLISYGAYQDAVIGVIEAEKKRIKTAIIQAKLEKQIKNNDIKFKLFKHGKYFTHDSGQIITYQIEQSRSLALGVDCSILYKSGHNNFFTYKFSFYHEVTHEKVIENSTQSIKQTYGSNESIYQLAFGKASYY